MRLLAPTLPALLLPFVSGVASLTWIKLSAESGPQPPPRRDAAIGYHGDSIVLFGGRGDMDQLYGDTWIYNLTKGSWSEVTGSTRPPSRFSFVSGISHGYFYVATGEGSGGVFHNDVWRFHFSFPKRPAQLPEKFSPSPRFGAAGGIHPEGNRLYVSLGFSTRGYYDTISYDTAGTTWYTDYPCRWCNPYNPSYPHPRYLHSGTMLSLHELVIFGGCLSGGLTSGPCPSGDSWIYSASSKTWTRLSDCLTPRLFSGMASLPSVGARRRAVLYGGVVDDRQVIRTRALREDEIGLLNPHNLTWVVKATKTPNMSLYPTVRASMAMATGSNGVYMFGGVEIKGSGLLNDLWLLEGDSYSADESETLPCTGAGFFNLAMIHGILMVIGWAVFLLWGAFVARYLKALDPVWFYIHVTFQVFGLCCVVAGLVFAILSVRSDHFRFAHGIVGMIAVLLAVIQPINAIFRPHRPEHPSLKVMRRRLWEWCHHACGLLAICLALVNVSLGVYLILSSIILWAVWFAYLSLVVVIWVSAELTLKCRRFIAKRRGDDTKSFVGVNNVDLKDPDLKMPATSGYFNHGMVSESSRL